MMMDDKECWNYRVIKRLETPGDESCYQVHEVYYDSDGNIEMWIDDPVEPSGESLEELREDLKHFSEALQKPVLVESHRDGRDVLLEDKMAQKPLMQSERRLKLKDVRASFNIKPLPEKLTIQGYDLLLTCEISPEQYDVFKERKLVGYLRLRHDAFRAYYPDVDGELVYETIVDEGDRKKVCECLAEAVRVINDKIESEA